MATKKYLDDNGLLYFWLKIKNHFAAKATTLAGYGITDSMTASEVNTAIQTALGSITGVSYQIVETLPQTGAAGVIYLVSNSGTGANVYDEYIYTNGAFEKIGSTDTDLSGYIQESDLVTITNGEIDTIVAS